MRHEFLLFLCRSKLTDRLLEDTTFENKESLMRSWEYWDTCTAVSMKIVEKLKKKTYTIETPEHGLVAINNAQELSRYQNVVKGGPTRVLLVTTQWKEANNEIFNLNPQMHIKDICTRYYMHFNSLDYVSCFLPLFQIYTTHCDGDANVIYFDVFLRATLIGLAILCNLSACASFGSE